jgi:hypothetical protein
MVLGLGYDRRAGWFGTRLGYDVSKVRKHAKNFGMFVY